MILNLKVWFNIQMMSQPIAKRWRDSVEVPCRNWVTDIHSYPVLFNCSIMGLGEDTGIIPRFCNDLFSVLHAKTNKCVSRWTCFTTTCSTMQGKIKCFQKKNLLLSKKLPTPPFASSPGKKKLGDDCQARNLCQLHAVIKVWAFLQYSADSLH